MPGLQSPFADGGCAPPSAAEESLLAARALSGDAEARAYMVRGNLRMVTRIARGYVGRGLPLEDLIAEGTIGLIRAVDMFNPSAGVRFATFAWVWIKQTIRRAIYGTGGTIRVPSAMFAKILKWRWAERSLTDDLGRKPADETIAEYLGLNAETAATVRLATRIRFAEMTGELGWTLDAAAVDRSRSIEAAADAMDAERELGLVMAAMAGLKPRESAILRLRFGLGGAEAETCAEIGRRHGISGARVYQIEMRAMEKLRGAVKRQKQLHCECRDAAIIAAVETPC